MRKFFSVLAFCILLLLGIRPGFAQEATPEVPTTDVIVTVDDPAVPAPEDSVAAILSAVAGVVLNSKYVVASMAIVVTIVSLLKILPFTQGVSAPVMTFGVAVIFWLVGVLLAQAGHEDQFFYYIGVFKDPVAAFGGLVITLLGSPWLHEQAAGLKAPLLGYKRTPLR
jgi:hypothetical protein